MDQTGFYRVKYEEELSAALRNAIEKKHLSSTDRFGNHLFLQALAYLFDSENCSL